MQGCFSWNERPWNNTRNKQGSVAAKGVPNTIHHQNCWFWNPKPNLSQPWPWSQFTNQSIVQLQEKNPPAFNWVLFNWGMVGVAWSRAGVLSGIHGIPWRMRHLWGRGWRGREFFGSPFPVPGRELQRQREHEECMGWRGGIFVDKNRGMGDGGIYI